MPDIEAKEAISNAVMAIAETGHLILNEGQFAKLLKLCEFVDLHGEEFCIDGFVADASHGCISVEMFDMVLNHGVEHPFFSYIKNADFFHIKKAGDGICLTMGVERLWSKVE